MVTKLLSSIGFIIVYAATLVLSYKQTQKQTQQLGSSERKITSYIVGVTMMLLGFVQFWLLTRLFPTTIILILAGVALLGWLLTKVIGFVAGFGNQQEKITVLNTIWGTLWGKKSPALGCLLWIVAMVVGFLLPVVAVYKFWRYPFRSTEAIEAVALSLFIIPQFLGILFGLSLITRFLVSEFIDADVRNFYLSNQFTSAIYATIALVFPVSLVSTDPHVVHWLPPGQFYWIAVTSPLLLFLLGGVLPYFLGAFRHRGKIRGLLKWRRDWLKRMYIVALSPSGPNRAQLFDQKLTELAKTIDERISNNPIIQLYNEIRPAETWSPPELPAPQQNAEPQSDTTGTPVPVQAAPGLSIQPAVDHPSASPVAANAQTDLATIPSVAEQFAKVRSLIEQHAEKLPHWDTQFHDLDKLTELHRFLIGSNPADVAVRDFIQLELRDTDEEIAGLTPKRTAAVSGLLTLLPNAGWWLVKTYQAEIIAFIHKHIF